MMRDPVAPGTVCAVMGPGQLMHADQEIAARVAEDAARWRREREGRADFSALPLADVPPSVAGFAADAAALEYVEVCLSTREAAREARRRVADAWAAYRAACPASFHQCKGPGWRVSAFERTFVDALREAIDERDRVYDAGRRARCAAVARMIRLAR